jgi:hypothetical protein
MIRMRALLTPAAICRTDEAIVAPLSMDRTPLSLTLNCCIALTAGAACYGVAFGIWRSPRQALYSAIKMPALLLSVTAVSMLINMMLAQRLGARLSTRQVATCILMSLTISAVILGALSPVTAFLSLQCPSPRNRNAFATYRILLLAHTAVVGIAGIAGNIRLYRLLLQLTGSTRIAARVLASWILVTGFAGCQLSWIMSPFLARPDGPVPFINPNAFTGNFFEYAWRAAAGGL